MEFAVEGMDVARALCDKLAGHDVFANISGESPVRVYIKDSESICNLLALVGAKKCFYELNNQIAMRSIRNVSNRRANCDNANIARQIKTAAMQIEGLLKIDLGTLPIELQQTARARIDNPDATLEELANILGVSKSGVKHRLTKIISMIH